MTFSPKGFKFAVARAGIKKPAVADSALIRADMALIYSEADAVAAAMFTTNRVKAAPVRLDMERIVSGRARAVIVNSGNANACTGKKGMRDAREMTALLAANLDVPERLCYVCSTGVIAVPLPMERIRPAVKELAASLGKSAPEDAARAVMTTDTFPKLASRKIKMGGKDGTILGFCKGAGMIRPDMATMLCFLMTDIAVEKRALKSALKEAVEYSFNRITVEGDMSTNDTVVAMANGMLGNAPVTKSSRLYGPFLKALSGVTDELSRMIVRDGEGATKLMEIKVEGAITLADAKRAAMAVSNSVLVKTAIYGGDPNVGRIMAALGYSGARMKEEKTDIFVGKVPVIRKGVSTGRQEEARKEFEKKDLSITIRLNSGGGAARVLTCDLTEEFVRLNAEYTT